MAQYDYDIGIIGAGAGGLTVAAGAAQLGAKTLLIEKEKELGGDCLHFGCVPSKTLIRSAHVYHLMKNAERFGLPKMDVPPVEFRNIAERVKSVINDIQHHDSVERFCGLGAQVEFGHPNFIDEHAIRLNGKDYSARSWVIASGSSAIIPPIKGLDRTPYITNREIFYLDHLPGSMIILGAGPIGVEMAQTFTRFGTAVSVVDMAPQILPKDDSDLANEVMAILSEEGVKFYTSHTIEAVNDTGNEREVIVKDKTGKVGNTFSLKAEVLLVALGRVANVEGLGLETIGVEHDRRSVKVDERMRTNHKHIYAVGDVNGGFQFTHTAGYEGGIVVSNAIFRLPRKADYTYLPWCTFTDPPLGNIGMNETMAKAAGIDYTVWTEEFKDNDRSVAEGEKIGKIKMLLNEKEKPVGVQILGAHAGDLLAEWVAVLNGKVKLSTLAAAVHPYPTIGEINKRVAGKFLSPKIFSEKIQKGLKFFFHLKGRACEIESGSI
ncbi:MAG: FAD-dependent oxidoreductase [Deltaproteobacteria bacterium]|jgi:pyruvate/2-oxoglutarate dehydrogenase complex dihydrolipoamide dehydrogenase (E3) component